MNICDVFAFQHNPYPSFVKDMYGCCIVAVVVAMITIIYISLINKVIVNKTTVPGRNLPAKGDVRQSATCMQKYRVLLLSTHIDAPF